MVPIIIATNNPGKRREMRELLRDFKLEIMDQDSLPMVDETGEDYAENAILKARTTAMHYGVWALGDDTGLEVDALDGAPGLRSARLAGPKATDADRRANLLVLLDGHERPWYATFVSVVALASPDGGVDVAEGRCRGEIIPHEQGEMGFGYDSIFLVEGENKTMAELTMDEKNRLSHRARAIRSLKPVLQKRLAK
jgi:XTP/dITP diphosphohydrolase